jgi:hypothetical protein
VKLEDRHPSVRDAAKWLTPNPSLPPGLPATVSAMFADMRDRLLSKLGDGPQLVIALRHLTDGRDAAVRQAIEDSDG